MGKSLNGKELGRGISQRKDGRYMGRFTNRFGKMETFYDASYNGIRKKLRDAQYEDERGKNIASSNMTLDEWFEVWMMTFKNNCRNTTQENYARDYKRVKTELGWRKIGEITPLMLQNALNKIPTYPSRNASKIVLGDLLGHAHRSRLIAENPAKDVSAKNGSVRIQKAEPRVMSQSEEYLFKENAKKSRYYNLIGLALETGLRIGELCGLNWSNVDFESNTINIEQNLVYCQDRKTNKCGLDLHDTKTLRGARKIPMTKKARSFLESQRVIDDDIRSKNSGKNGAYADFIFISSNLKPAYQGKVYAALGYISKRIQKEYPEFKPVTPHTLRHTFATRAIERGMLPKSLQKILGHASLQTTMDLYCHATDECLIEEMKKFSQE